MVRDEDALRTQLEEARRHLDVQIASYRRLEDKSIDVVKLGALVLALVTSGLGIIARTEPAPELPPWAGAATAAGVLAVVGSAGIAAFASASVQLRVGVLGFGEAAESAGPGAARTYTFLLRVYDEMIERNGASVERKARAVDYSIFSFLAGITLLGATAIVLIAEVV